MNELLGTGQNNNDNDNADDQQQYAEEMIIDDDLPIDSSRARGSTNSAGSAVATSENWDVGSLSFRINGALHNIRTDELNRMSDAGMGSDNLTSAPSIIPNTSSRPTHDYSRNIRSGVNYPSTSSRSANRIANRNNNATATNSSVITSLSVSAPSIPNVTELDYQKKLKHILVALMTRIDEINSSMIPGTATNSIHNNSRISSFQRYCEVKFRHDMGKYF
jgi:hypothetical protein